MHVHILLGYEATVVHHFPQCIMRSIESTIDKVQ